MRSVYMGTVGLTIIPAMGRRRQQGLEFEANLGYISEFQASLGYIVRPCLKNHKTARRW
jgi:hypothetical protein